MILNKINKETKTLIILRKSPKDIHFSPEEIVRTAFSHLKMSHLLKKCNNFIRSIIEPLEPFPSEEMF